jgi:hypothetical protein
MNIHSLSYLVAAGFLTFASVGICLAQWKNTASVQTGSLHQELVVKHAQPKETGAGDVPSEQPNRLSPLRAGVFSIVVPGAGQAYSGRYLEAAAFAVVEAGLWILYAKNHSNGVDKTAEYQLYADANWSVIRYSDWMDSNYRGKGSTALDDALGRVVTSRSGPFPWSGIDWGLLNYCESEIARLAVPGAPNGFTHILPVRPAQQYYELIGKYPQYVGGWNDAWGSGGTSLYTEADVLNSNVSPNFLHYRDMRGDANSFYNNATAAAYVLVANHVFSALEAAFGASRHNKRIQLEGRLIPISRESGVVIVTPTAFVKLSL